MPKAVTTRIAEEAEPVEAAPVVEDVGLQKCKAERAIQRSSGGKTR
jgi:hypothetical protein